MKYKGIKRSTKTLATIYTPEFKERTINAYWEYCHDLNQREFCKRWTYLTGISVQQETLSKWLNKEKGHPKVRAMNLLQTEIQLITLFKKYLSNLRNQHSFSGTLDGRLPAFIRYVRNIREQSCPTQHGIVDLYGEVEDLLNKIIEARPKTIDLPAIPPNAEIKTVIGSSINPITRPKNFNIKEVDSDEIKAHLDDLRKRKIL